MATTDQPHDPAPEQQPQDAPTIPLPPAPALPQQPVYATAPQPQQPVYATVPAGAAPGTAPPAPPASSGSHVGVIIASIVGGLVLLGLAFGAGAVFGWVAGTYHSGRVVAEQGPWWGGESRWHDEGPGWRHDGQGPGQPQWPGGPQEHRHGDDGDQGHNGGEPAPAPTP